MRKFRRDAKPSKPRLVALGALLVIAVVWARSETTPRRKPAAGPASGATAGTAIAMPAPSAIATGDRATPEGWGTDPFDPRPLGSTSVTTGR